MLLPSFKLLGRNRDRPVIQESWDMRGSGEDQCGAYGCGLRSPHSTGQRWKGWLWGEWGSTQATVATASTQRTLQTGWASNNSFTSNKISPLQTELWLAYPWAWLWITFKDLEIRIRNAFPQALSPFRGILTPPDTPLLTIQPFLVSESCTNWSSLREAQLP